MPYHIAPLGEWNAAPHRPYAPASLAEEGFVHCSPDEETTLAVVNAFYRSAPRPLPALILDEGRLTARLEGRRRSPRRRPGSPRAPRSAEAHHEQAELVR
jgi:uncharacterized protein (DUF952 family)